MTMLPYLEGSCKEFVEAADVEFVAGSRKKKATTYPAHRWMLARCCSCFAGSLGLAAGGGAAAAPAAGDALASGSKRKRGTGGDVSSTGTGVLSVAVDTSPAALELFLCAVYMCAPQSKFASGELSQPNGLSASRRIDRLCDPN